jgi:predicted acylesterase/phospholipase RssA
MLHAVQQEQDIDKAREMLRQNNAGYEELRTYAKKMKGYSAFTYARRLLEQAVSKITPNHPDYEYLIQQLAISTYKDVDLPLIQRLDRALKILGALGLDGSQNPETLGIAGSIYKQKWQAEKRNSDLKLSSRYYTTGHEVDMTLVEVSKAVSADSASPPQSGYSARAFKKGHRFGWPGINAALMLDVDDQKDRANALRRQIADHLSKVVTIPEAEFADNDGYDRFWIGATLAEAYFGLGQFDKASEALEKVSEKVDPWKLQVFAQQLIRVAEPRKTQKQAREILERIVGDANIVQDAVRGKVGLALSGGGFRASLYHLGVLAKLAELDVLKHVEAISCVSGGSIIGTLYYIELRRLLQTKDDGQIDYVDLVKRVTERFVSGIQKNIRIRLFWNPWTNIKMIFLPRYSRTVRAGELMEELLYKGAADGEGDDKRWINEMFIEPYDAKLTFQPKNDNWRRINKIPILILNATCLNTGNNWQFTASWMGEPPPPNEHEFDGKARLRRTYYHEAPKTCNEIRLGTAVGASACVPGVFEPIILDRLYDGYIVRLVDGGVFDNQGLSALVDLGCESLLISDGSGQTKSDVNPHAGSLAPLARANDITMQCVRDAQLRHLQMERRIELVSRTMTVHLKKDLGPTPINWIKCMDPVPPAPNNPSLPYGILRSLQNYMSATRTDLDSFSDAEAYALMTSGYLMAEQCARIELRGTVEDERLDAASDPSWEFLTVRDELTKTASKAHDRLERILKASHAKAFKVFRICPWQATGLFLLVALFLSGLVWGLTLLPVWKGAISFVEAHQIWLAIGIFAVLLAKIIADGIAFRHFRPLMLITTPIKMLSAIAVGIVGWIAAAIQLKVFDPLYLWYGRKDHFGA